MAANRYGQIWHGDHHHINIRFPSNEARLKFQIEFEAYHASHDHEGDVPAFISVTTKDLKLGTGSRSPQDLVKAETDKDYRITIDGYSWSEIHEYHNPSGFSEYFWYRVPTCCVPPTIVIDHEFVDSNTLQRHELSAIFGDMPETDFQSLLESVQTDGFIDPIIRIHEGKILDGWHRYRAAQELNLIRRLRFQEWNEDDKRDGDPKVFVLARNIERRHLSAGQRAQIAVTFNERFEHGANRFTLESPNDDSKTRTELAEQVGVGTSTIDRAVQIEKAGQSEAVIAGEKTAGEVLEEQKAKASAETEAAIAVVKPRFQNSVETWRSLQVERLRKFEDLPVGRTPLIESEYLKTYFELAQPRIQQNTKPTAVHYEGAIECMRDLPVAFAEQLEGRHYRRIIKEWDTSVLLQLVERFQSGHILGYPALQTDSDGNAARIRQVIRDHYGFQGRITTQPFEVLFEITEDAHAVLVQLNPKEWIRDGHEISWALSVLPEPIETSEPTNEDVSTSTASKDREASKLLKKKKQTLKSMWDKRIQASTNYVGDGDTDLNKYLCLTDLEKGFAEYEGHSYCADAFRSAFQRTSETSFNIVVEKTLESDVSLEVLREESRAMDTYAYDILQWQKQEWIQQLIEEKRNTQFQEEERLAEQQQLARDTQKLRITIQEYLLNTGLTYRIGLDSVIKKLAKDYQLRDNFYEPEPGGTHLDDLQSEHNTLAAVFVDLQNPDSTLRKELDTLTAESESKPDDLDTLWEAFNKRLPKWKAKYAESGYKENDLIQQSTESDLFDALRIYRESDQTGEPTTEEIQDVTDLMKDQSYVFTRRVRDVVRQRLSQPETSSETTQHEHTLVAIEKLKTGLKKAHVIDSEAFADDILQFYNGVDLSELSTSPQETLKNISDFIEGFVDEPLQTWPEYIRNHRWMPKRELVLVSIGINNNTDDEFEMVEFTDERNTDEIRCDLNELPEDLRTALLKIAAEKIYAEAVKEFHTDGG